MRPDQKYAEFDRHENKQPTQCAHCGLWILQDDWKWRVNNPPSNSSMPLEVCNTCHWKIKMWQGKDQYYKALRQLNEEERNSGRVGDSPNPV